MFFRQLQQFDAAPAIITADEIISYAQLHARCMSRQQQLPPKRSLIFIIAHNHPATLTTYLACLQSNHCALLLDPMTTSEQLDVLCDTYQPAQVWNDEVLTIKEGSQSAIDEHAALLLSTSGSTGSPKQVVLSYTNLQHNAQSICDYLPIKSTDVTITTLPFCYSYGLSVINTHLMLGAAIVMLDDAVTSRPFWEALEQHKVTSFAGVPYLYQMLVRLGFTRKAWPHLRYLTQAGGRLYASLRETLREWADAHQVDFFSMYGQTEATARMAYVKINQQANLPEGCIGQPIPGGQFTLEHAQVDEHGNEVGELVYQGANVMLGYAQQRSELTKIPPLKKLATGDLAYFDEQCGYIVCGRLKRITKVFGRRINLDEVERLMAQKGLETFSLGTDNKLQIAVKNNNDIKALKTMLSQLLQLHISAIDLRSIEDVPLTANGKPDYPALQEWFNG